MQKIINFRSIFFIFLLLIGCIYCSFKLTTSLFYLFFLIIPILWIIYLIIKKRFVLFTTSLILIIFTSCFTYFKVANFNDLPQNSTNLTITAKIEDIRPINEDFCYLTLTNVKVEDENRQQTNLKGNLSVGVNNFDDINFDIGYNISFYSTLEPVSLQGENFSIYLKNNIRYQTSKSINLQNATLSYGEKSLIEKFKEYNSNLLINNLGEDNGNIAFAVLYGDTGNVDKSLLEVFKYTGIMHIFSVSGLHISLLVTLIYFVLKKLKVKNWLSFIILAVCLSVFCCLCSFSAPVVRSTIMALTVLLSTILSRKNDPLNTLSLSGVILLVLNPLSLFDGGFQMSFIAVFGILFFGSLFNKVKINNNFFKKLFLAVSVSLATQLAMMPILAEFYGYFSTWSLIANLATLPIFSVFYILLFSVNLLVLILPFLSFLYVLPKFLLEIITFININIASLPYAIIKTYSWGAIGSVLYYLFMFSVSKYLVLGVKAKFFTSGIFLLVSMIFILSSALPFVSKQNKIYFENSYQTGYTTMFTTNKNEFYLINPNFTYSGIKNLKNTLQNKKVRYIKGVFFTNNQSFDSLIAYSFLKDITAIVYLPKGHSSVYELRKLGIPAAEVDLNVDYKVSNFNIKYLTYNNTMFSMIINFENKNYLEVDANQVAIDQNFAEYINSDLNFYLDCVKINNSYNNFDFNNLFNTNNLVYLSNGSFC